MLLRHPVIPDGGFITVFIGDFADVCAFVAVWIRRAGVVAQLVRVPGGGTGGVVGRCPCRSANR